MNDVISVVAQGIIYVFIIGLCVSSQFFFRLTVGLGIIAILDELGKVLIKGFIFAVTQLDTLPKKMLFYNGGATLTAEGSDSLEDLKSLEAQGVEILTCGTCLDYYHLKEKLAVGSVTNMYAIVEAMAEAGRIIRP